MIKCSNIIRYNNIDFKDYLELPGYSNSWLKRERFGIVDEMQITDNIKRGALVDNILTEPHKVDMSSPLYPQARDIAQKIRSTFGPMVERFTKQVSFTADLEYEGFVMRSKGRLDFLLEGKAVIDLKVTASKDVRAIIKHMQYENQMWNYCKMSNVNTSFLMMHSIPLKKTEIIKIDCSSNENEFWENKIQKFGKVKEAA